MSTNNSRICMFVCTTVLYEYMNLLYDIVYNLFGNIHVWIKIYQKFYHCIIYITNEGRRVRIAYNMKKDKHFLCLKIKMEISTNFFTSILYLSEFCHIRGHSSIKKLTSLQNLMVLNNVAVYEKNREIPNDGEMFHSWTDIECCWLLVNC